MLLFKFFMFGINFENNFYNLSILMINKTGSYFLKTGLTHKKMSFAGPVISKTYA